MSEKEKYCQKIENYRELLENTVSKYPENIAYKFKKDINAKQPEYVNITYSQFKKDVEGLSTALLNLELEKEKIVIIGSNRYEWCTSYLAITTGNMIIVPIDKMLPESEIETLVMRSGAKAAIFEKKFIDIFKKIKKEENSALKLLICMDNIEDEEIIKHNEILEEGKRLLAKGNSLYKGIKIDKDKMSVMLFTSGTTNNPKAVMLSQKNICSNVQSFAEHVKLYTTDTLLSFLPMHHTMESTGTFLCGLYFGATVAFCDGLKYIAKNLVEYKISVFVAVPLVLENMYKKIQQGIQEQGKTKLINNMSKITNMLLKCKIDIRKKVFKQILSKFGGNLRIVIYGAAPMNRECIVAYTNFGLKMIQGYGLTEASPMISCETDDKQKPGSAGLIFDSLEVKIENPDAEGIGEITVKGPSIMLGYYENEEATNKVLKDGWFSTGDYGYIDPEGFLYITGRKSDVIVLKNGKNVYPQEIEELINQNPYIVESMVYSKDTNMKETVLCAKIVYDKDFMESQYGVKTEDGYKEVIWKKVKEINQTLPLYKYIKEISVTTEPFSKTSSSKIKRYKEIEKVK